MEKLIQGFTDFIMKIVKFFQDLVKKIRGFNDGKKDDTTSGEVA